MFSPLSSQKEINMPNWTQTIAKKANHYIRAVSLRRIPGYAGFNRLLRENDIRNDAPRTLQEGQLYGLKNVISMTKAAEAYNKAAFQRYSALLSRKAGGRQQNVDQIAAFVAILVMTQVPLTDTVAPPKPAAPTPVACGAPTPSPTPAATPTACAAGATPALVLEDSTLDSWEDGDW